MSTLVDAETGRVPGDRGRTRVRRALRTGLTRAAIGVDAFPLVRLGNDVVTRVRRRVTRTIKAGAGA